MAGREKKTGRWKYKKKNEYLENQMSFLRWNEKTCFIVFEGFLLGEK